MRAARLVGLARALTIVPGIARSCATLTPALWLGVALLEAAAFSFLMSLPTIAGTGVLEFAVLGPELARLAGRAAWTGVVAVAALLAIRFFLPPSGVCCGGVGPRQYDERAELSRIRPLPPPARPPQAGWMKSSMSGVDGSRSRWMVPVNSRQSGPFSRYSRTMDSDVFDWQGRQIVQSPLNLDDSLP